MSAVAVKPSENPADAIVAPSMDSALLTTMHEKHQRLEESESALRGELERKDRDASRTEIMLNVLQEQMSMAKEHQLSLRKDFESTRDKLAKAEEIAEDRLRQCQRVEEELNDARTKAQIEQNSLKKSLDARDVKVSQLEGSLARLRKELDETKALALKVTENGEKSSRSAYETKVHLQAQLSSRTDELETVSEALKKLEKDSSRKETENVHLITKLRKELKDTNEALTDDRRKAFETVTQLKNENECLRLQLAQVEGSIKSSDRDSFEKISRLTEELSMFRERSTRNSELFDRREKEFATRESRLISDLQRAQAELTQLSEKEAGATKDHVEAIVALSATRDTLRARVASLTDEVHALQEQQRLREVQWGTERDLLRKERKDIVRDHAAVEASKNDQITKLNNELTLTVSRMNTAETDLAALKKAVDHKSSVHTSEVGALRAEIEGYKSSVKRLEAYMKENYAYKVLEEQCECLKAQNMQLKNQVSHANNILSNLRVEADVSENYRIKMMQEQVEEMLVRVSTLEKERRFARPLMYDLTEIVQRHSLVDAALAKDIDTFTRQFGNFDKQPPRLVAAVEAPSS